MRVTMRVKTEWLTEKDEKTGRMIPRKVGLAPVMRDGVEYEFDVCGDLDTEMVHAAPAFKALRLWTRTPIYLELPALPRHGLIVGEKYAPTPEAYPRRAGMPRKRPLA